MKKYATKYITLILGFIFTFTIVLSNTANAIVNDRKVSFNIYAIANMSRFYNNGIVEDYYSYSNNGTSAKDGGSYYVNGLEFGIYTEFINGIDHISLIIDDNFSEVGSTGMISQEVLKDGDHYYTDTDVKYLSPGKHKVQLLVNLQDPNSIVSKTIEIKRTIYVTVTADVDQYIAKSLDNVNDGTATFDDYKNLAINPQKIKNAINANMLSLDELNEKVKGQNLTIDNVQSTVYGIISDATADYKSNASMVKINSGSGSATDYKNIGIQGVDSYNLAAINSQIKSMKSINGDDLTLDEIEQAVNSVVSATERIQAGEGTVSDYNLLGITTVTTLTLDDVNWYVKNNNSVNVSKIKSNVSTILNSLSFINKGTLVSTYYTTLGITGVTSDTATQVKASILNAVSAKGSDLTKTEIEQIVTDVAGPINSTINRISSGDGTIADYQSLGIATVTTSTLDDVNWYVNSRNGNTISSIKSNVTTMLNALNVVNKGTNVLTSYTTLGIKGVTADNVGLVKTAILAAVSAKDSNLTRTEIEQVSNGVTNSTSTTIDKIQSGEGTLNDYQSLGITTVTESTLDDVNWYVKNHNGSSIALIKSYVTTMINALNYINNGTLSPSYYSTLGISNVTSDNAAQVKTAILSAVSAKGSNLNKSEIEQIANSAVKATNMTISSIQEGNGALSDYQSLGITTVTALTLDDVNWYMKNNNSSTISRIKSNATLVINALNYINKGTTVSSYYNTLGITGVTSKNATQVKAAILSAVSAKGSNLTRSEIKESISNILSTLDTSSLSSNLLLNIDSSTTTSAAIDIKY